MVRYQRVRAATLGFVSLQPEGGGQRPERPAVDPGRGGELGGLGGGPGVEERDRGTRGLATTVDRGERRSVAIDPDRDDVDGLGRVQRADGADHRGPPRTRVLFRPPRSVPDLEAVARPGDRQQPPVEGHEARLDLGRAEIEAEDGGRSAVVGHAGGVSASRATTASAVATSVTSVRIAPLRSAPRTGRTLLSPAPTPIATGTRPSARASKASTRSRRAGQTNWPSMSKGAMRISPTAPARSSSAATSSPTDAAPQRPAADPDERDIEPAPQVEDGADAGVRLEGVLGRGVVDEPGHHQAMGLRTEGVGDAAERLALGTGRPVAAGQRHDRRADRRRRILEGVGHGTDRRAIPDPDDRAVADPGAQDLRREPADHAAGEVLGAGDGRGEMDGVQAVAPAQGIGGRRLDGGLVDDADLDDALGPGALQEAAHLRAG